VNAGAAYNNTMPTWMALARIAMLCNRAEFQAQQDHIPVLKRFELGFLLVIYIFYLFILFNCSVINSGKFVDEIKWGNTC